MAVSATAAGPCGDSAAGRGSGGRHSSPRTAGRWCPGGTGQSRGQRPHGSLPAIAGTVPGSVLCPSCSGAVCLACQHFTKRCRQWVVRRELAMGWCPDGGELFERVRLNTCGNPPWCECQCLIPLKCRHERRETCPRRSRTRQGLFVNRVPSRCLRSRAVGRQNLSAAARAKTAHGTSI